MTLGQVLARAKNPPKVGDHEIVMGPDGLGHLLVITRVHQAADAGRERSIDLSFMSRCQAIKGNVDVQDLEIAPTITCVNCVQW